MENIFTASKAFLTALRFIGFFPASQEKPFHKGLFKVKLNGVISSCTFFSLLIYLIVSINQQSRFLPPNFSEISFQAYFLTKNFELFSFIFLLIYQATKWKNILKFLQSIQEIDDEVRFNI